MSFDSTAAAAGKDADRAILRMALSLVMVSIGTGLSYVVDQTRIDFPLLVAGSLLTILVADEQYYRGWRIAVLVSLFAAQILTAIGFSLAFFINGGDQESGRIYLLAGISGLIGFMLWAVGLISRRY